MMGSQVELRGENAVVTASSGWGSLHILNDRASFRVTVPKGCFYSYSSCTINIVLSSSVKGYPSSPQDHSPPFCYCPNGWSFIPGDSSLCSLLVSSFLQYCCSHTSFVSQLPKRAAFVKFCNASMQVFLAAFLCLFSEAGVAYFDFSSLETALHFPSILRRYL